MIEDQEVTLNGQPYVWSHDEAVDSPLECWKWVDPQNMSAPQGLIDGLNRRFIDRRAADVAATLDDVEAARFCRILKAMGATDADISAAGLGSVFVEAFPEKALSKFVEDMPPAAHLPFNSVVLRDWYFQKQLNVTSLPTEVRCMGHGPFLEIFFDYV